MKYLILLLTVLTACTVSTTDSRFKVSDRAYTKSDFYLGSGTLTIQRVYLDNCSGEIGYKYIGDLDGKFGRIDDVEACESELD